jgi:hypothetical protein
MKKVFLLCCFWDIRFPLENGRIIAAPEGNLVMHHVREDHAFLGLCVGNNDNVFLDSSNDETRTGIKWYENTLPAFDIKVST